MIVKTRVKDMPNNFVIVLRAKCIHKVIDKNLSTFK